MNERKKKIVMWIALFMIAFPMPIIIYFGLKMSKPPPFKSDCGKIPYTSMTREKRESCKGFNPADVVPNPLKLIPFF